jgi:hypothetical protein
MGVKVLGFTASRKDWSNFMIGKEDLPNVISSTDEIPDDQPGRRVLLKLMNLLESIILSDTRFRENGEPMQIQRQDGIMGRLITFLQTLINPAPNPAPVVNPAPNPPKGDINFHILGANLQTDLKSTALIKGKCTITLTRYINFRSLVNNLCNQSEYKLGVLITSNGIPVVRQDLRFAPEYVRLDPVSSPEEEQETAEAANVCVGDVLVCNDSYCIACLIGREGFPQEDSLILELPGMKLSYFTDIVAAKTRFREVLTNRARQGFRMPPSQIKYTRTELPKLMDTEEAYTIELDFSEGLSFDLPQSN